MTKNMQQNTDQHVDIDEQKFILEQIKNDKIIESLSDLSSATEVTDIAVDDSAEDVIQVLNLVDDVSAETLESLTTEKQIHDYLLEKIRKFDPEEKIKAINEIAKLHTINPGNKSFTSISVNKRKFLLDKLYEKKQNMEIERKNRFAKDN